MKKLAKQSMSWLQGQGFSPMDILPNEHFCEKCIDLVVNGGPDNLAAEVTAIFSKLREYLMGTSVADVKVVVFGGGSGLSNIIGGDSRLQGWEKDPFKGLKEIFPQTKSIVCVTDDGGSTGEIIKDLPLIALGDIRHVLLSSVQEYALRRQYGVSRSESLQIVAALFQLFNARFKENTISHSSLTEKVNQHAQILPAAMMQKLLVLISNLFEDKRLVGTLKRPHCLGNLLLVSAIYKNIASQYTHEDLEKNQDIVKEAVVTGINELGSCIGVAADSVLPCSTTPAQLRFCYSNGVEVSGESKSGNSNRGFPVDHVVVDFSDSVRVPQQVINDIEQADVLVMAPGSLYSSIIPIFQVPGLADAVRKNEHALKILVSNIWVQTGETDISVTDPERKFHVSDMIRAYERNIPGGNNGLFDDVLCISLKDIPGSVLQNYAVEGKMPIFLDRNLVASHGLSAFESEIYSKHALAKRGVIQHDPHFLAVAIKTIYLARDLDDTAEKEVLKPPEMELPFTGRRKKTIYPSCKYRLIRSWVDRLRFNHQGQVKPPFATEDVQEKILAVIWKHQDIPVSHLQLVQGVEFIDPDKWQREQRWDKVFSFYDPFDLTIKIRSDQVGNFRDFELAFLIALGQSLLGNYAAEKIIREFEIDGHFAGKVYHLTVKDHVSLKSFFSRDEIYRFLLYARMNRVSENSSHFIRVVNGREGFTPPGVLMGLCYVWYLDNRLASHIEYKMAVMKIRESDLIPEQRKMKNRRIAIIDFFRDVVFA